MRGATIQELHTIGNIVISTHAPLAGRDERCIRTFIQTTLFQPTRPLRGATNLSEMSLWSMSFQPTRPLRGATISPLSSTGYCIGFQPTRPLRGATSSSWSSPSSAATFQPTRPLRGATLHVVAIGTYAVISTHAPLAGRDPRLTGVRQVLGHFNPRAPCGARLRKLATMK